MSRWLPANVSTYGPEIDGLFFLIYYITGIAFVLVAAAMIAFLIIYRDKGDGRRATYSHGNNTLEVIWTAIPAAIFVLLAVMSSRSWSNIKIHMPPADMTITVVAKQFEWRFIYHPGADGKIGTKDDVFDDNGFRVPVNKVVHLNLTSVDVIHSFFVPQLRLKQDAVPGRTIPAWFEATAAGNYEIACAELCGYGHTTMAGNPRKDNPNMGGGLHVLSQAEFDEWARKKSPLLLAAPAAPLEPAATPVTEPVMAPDLASPTPESK